MYTITREVTFKTLSDAVRAMPLVAAITKYYKDKLNVDLRIMRPIGGTPTRLRFVFEMESLDAWQAGQMKAVQDPEYQKVLGEFGPLVDGSKTYDEIWR